MFKLIKENQKVQEILIIIFFLIPGFLFAILAPIYSSSTFFFHNYLIREKVKKNKIDIGCLYYHHTYYKLGEIGYYFKINGVLIKDLNLTIDEFPFAKKEIQFLNKFNSNSEKSRKQCYYVRYVYVKFLFKEQVIIYDLI